MSLKKNLTFFTALTGTVIGTMHVVNRIFQYISTADNMLSDDKYDGDLEKLLTRRPDQDHPFS